MIISSRKQFSNAIILISLLITLLTCVEVAKNENNNIGSGKNSTKFSKETSKEAAKKLRKKEALETMCIKNSNFDNNECDIVSPGAICSFGGQKIVLPKKVPKGLVGYWNFDDIRALDSTGNRNHAKNIIKPGPSMSGQGASALFSNGDYLSIPYNESFGSSDYTITFWVFMIKDYFTQSKGIRFCPLIQRGKDDLFSKSFQRAPGLYYDRVQKNLKVFVSTKLDSEPQGESLTSHAQINPQRWMHIAIVKTDMKVKLYINGILDNSIILKDEISESNKSDFYIGNVPWLKDQCAYPFLMDEMRYYNIAVQEELIQAEASPALGGLDPGFITLGGIDMAIREAGNSCTDGFHICTSIELHTGGYQVARAMGWLDWNTHIWSHGALKTPSEFAGMKGLALCCADLR